eukprot:6201668-Pleurochrysis_carterae.AAC.4
MLVSTTSSNEDGRCDVTDSARYQWRRRSAQGGHTALHSDVQSSHRGLAAEQTAVSRQSERKLVDWWQMEETERR